MIFTVMLFKGKDEILHGGDLFAIDLRDYCMFYVMVTCINIISQNLNQHDDFFLFICPLSIDEVML